MRLQKLSHASLCPEAWRGEAYCSSRALPLRPRVGEFDQCPRLSMFFPKDPAKGFSQNSCCHNQFLLLNTAAPTSYASPTDIIYINFMYTSTTSSSVTCFIYYCTSHKSSTSSTSSSNIYLIYSTLIIYIICDLQVLHVYISYKTPAMSFAQEFLHRNCYIGFSFKFLYFSLMAAPGGGVRNATHAEIVSVGCENVW